MMKPVVVYESETWAVTEVDVKRLHAREKKILRNDCMQGRGKY
jgi:hypothetical protein